MLFNSYIFIFLFLPTSLLGYFLLNRFKKYTLAKYFLIAMSFWFYAYFNFTYLWIMLFSVCINYVCHLLIIRRFHPKLTYCFGLAANIGLLFYYKYFDFLLENLNALFHTGFDVSILLPLGISFFTFQQIAFLIDTYKGIVDKQDFADHALFVTFFPQLIAGPITTYEEMLPQYQDLTRKSPRADNFYLGFRIFVRGLAKKMLLADTFGLAVDWGFQYYTLLDGFDSFVLILFYAFQLYFDFSGYCDMARGIGYLFNIQIPINFFSPYKSRNILEFWERWHITLKRFFTRYIYIPLGGSRKGTGRTYLNTFIVFLVSGIWHGAEWTYIAWGIMHGIMSMLTRMWHKCKKRFHLSLPQKHILTGPVNVLTMLVTFFFFVISLAFFRSGTMAQAFDLIKNIFCFQNVNIAMEWTYFFQIPELWYVIKFFGLHNAPYGAYYCLILFMAVSVYIIFFRKNLYETENEYKPGFWDAAFTAFLALWCVLSLSGVSSFLYFNF